MRFAQATMVSTPPTLGNNANGAVSPGHDTRVNRPNVPTLARTKVPIQIAGTVLIPQFSCTRCRPNPPFVQLLTLGLARAVDALIWRGDSNRGVEVRPIGALGVQHSYLFTVAET